MRSTALMMMILSPEDMIDEYDDAEVIVMVMTVSSANDGDLHPGLGQRWI